MPARRGKDQANAGQYQRPKPLRPSAFYRVTMETGDDAPELWWDERGALFTDEDRTKWSGLVIVEIVD